MWLAIKNFILRLFGIPTEPRTQGDGGPDPTKPNK